MARKRKAQAEGESEAWLTTYGDMVTLLMCFFVLLYAMSSTDVAKFEAFLAGLAEPFGNEAGEGILPAKDGLVEEGAPSIDPAVLTPETAAPDAMIEDDAFDAEAEEAAEDATQARLDEVQAALDAALSEAGLSDLVEQRREERGLVVSIASDDVLFALGSTEISSIGERVIATVAATLGDFSNDVLVEGHTDDLPLRRGGYTNWNLSTDRAVAVLTEMVSEHAFPEDRIGAVGYGEFRPLVENKGRTTRARNRRVDIVVLREEVTP